MKRIYPVFIAVVLILIPSALYAFSIEIDYTYDTASFFSTEERKTSLQNAVSVFTSRITTSLSSITPSGENSWTNTFWDPASATGQQTLTNSTIAADKLVIYVGGFNQSGSLGWGGPGWSSSTGSAEWLNTVSYRVRDTSLFSPWGGSMSFDKATDWYFGTGAVPETQMDFYSVAIHEIGHILGIGTAAQWSSKLTNVGSDYYFTGAYSVAMYGNNNVPTSGLKSSGGDDNAHWKAGVTSTVPGTLTVQEASMTPTVGAGTRKYFTDLDWAGLKDMGWDVAAVPEPSLAALFIAGLSLTSFFFRNRRG